MKHANFLLFNLIVFSTSELYSQPPWYESKDLPGANLFSIQQDREATKAQREAAPQDLTLLLNDPEFYEVGREMQYHRWLSYVEPRVAPSGDLSLLDIGQQEALSFVPLNGVEPPLMAGNWEPLGPFATNTMGAGRLNWIEFHPTDNNIIMVGSAGGGLWISRDAGVTWSTSTDKLAVLGVAWAVFDPSNPNTIYLGTGDGDHGDTKSIGVLKSTDGGVTWNTTGLTFTLSGSTQITKLLIDPRNPDKLYVGASNGLHVSTDGAVTFRQVSGITSKIYDIEMHPTNSNIVYASTTALYVSTDGGATFTRNTNLTAASTRMQLAVSANQPNNLYALRGAQNGTEGVHRSTNSGQAFSQTGSGSAIGCDQTWYDYGFDANPVNGNELIAGCLQIYRSADGGANWSQAGNSYHVDIHGTTYRRDGTLFTVGDGGIWRSTGTTTWANLNNNLNIGQSYRIGVYKNDYDRVCTGRQDNGSDIRDVNTSGFKRALGGDGMECFWNAAGTSFYGETQNGGFERCNYANGAVSGCTDIDPGSATTWDTPWGQDPINANTLFAGRSANMYRSTDQGNNWSQIGTVGGSGSIRNFTVAPSNSSVLYVMKGTDVIKTTNGGTNWTNIKGSITGTPFSASVSETNPNDVWVSVSGYTATSKIWHSTDGGTSWTNETGTGLPNVPASAVAVDNLGQNGVYLGTDAGVFYKKNGLTSWQNFSSNLPNAAIRELEIARKGTNNADRKLVAATFGRGVWRTTLWDDNPTGMNPGPRLPSLRRFTTSTSGTTLTLRFQLGTDRFDRGHSEIQLTTIDGKMVHHEIVQNFGLYEKRIDVSGWGKGVYLFVLKNAHERTIRRLAF